MKLIQPANTGKYIVKGSDTLSSIALRYNTTPTELSRLNRLSTTLLFPGQTLFVPEKPNELKEKEDEVTVEIKDTNCPNAPVAVKQRPLRVPPSYRTMSPTKIPLSPDRSLEDLLNRQNSDEEVSRRYLKIKSKYITDGQGVVSGVLLVTPQTIMFNPSVSDHLVIDRGRDYYVVRLPLKALSMVTLYDDIAAMVTDDLSKQYIPVAPSNYGLFSPPKPGVIVCQQTGEEYKLKNNTKSRTNSTNNREDFDTVKTELESLTVNELPSLNPNNKLGNDATDGGGDSSLKENDKALSTPEFSNAEPAKVQKADIVTNQEPSNACSKNKDIGTDDPNMGNLNCKPTDGDHGASNNISSASSDLGVETMTGDLSNETVINNETIGSTDVKPETLNDPVITKSANVNAIHSPGSPQSDDGNLHNNIKENHFFANHEHASSTPKHCCTTTTASDGKTIHSDCTEGPGKPQVEPSSLRSTNTLDGSTKKNMNLNLKIPQQEDNNSNFSVVNNKNINSKKGGKSIGNQFSRNPAMFDSSKDSGFSEMTRSQQSIDEGDSQQTKTLANAERSALSDEAKKWLGNHDVTSPTVSFPISPTDSDRNVTSPDIVPQPALKFEDPLMYISINVSKRYWCPALAKLNAIMGIPPNRDQKRRQHWFAIPRERIDQFYGFVLQWIPDVYSRGSTPSPDIAVSEAEEGIQIVDDTFGVSPATTFGWEKLHIDDAGSMQKFRFGSIASSKTSLRSFGDDEPEMSNESSLLTKEQMKQLSHKLPSRTVGHYMQLIYSTMEHGISLSTLYRNCASFDCAVLLVLTDQKAKKFGAFLSDPPMVSEGFYGTGECMLFTFVDEKILGVYNWSGENSFFIKGSKTSLSIGGGEGVLALWLDEDLYHGRSHSCKTFNNETLSASEDFICSQVEAWGFI